MYFSSAICDTNIGVISRVLCVSGECNGKKTRREGTPDENDRRAAHENEVQQQQQ